MTDKVIFKMPMTKAERAHLMHLAKADGRTMIAYCRNKVGLSFILGETLVGPSTVNLPIAREVAPAQSPMEEVLEWQALDREEQIWQAHQAVADGKKRISELGPMQHHPVDPVTKELILKNAAGKWIVVGRSAVNGLAQI